MHVITRPMEILVQHYGWVAAMLWIHSRSADGQGQYFLYLFKHICSYHHPQVTGRSGEHEFFGQISDPTAMRLSPDFYRLSIWTCFKIRWTAFECLRSVVRFEFCNRIRNCELTFCWACVYSSCGWSFPRLQWRNGSPSAAAVTGVPRLSSCVHFIILLLSYWFFRAGMKVARRRV